MKHKFKHALCCAAAAVFTSVCLFSFSSSVYAAPILKLNSRGHDVAVLQQSLIRENYGLKAVSGTFDKETQEAVKSFQKKNKLNVTGIVDRETWWAIKGGRPSASQTIKNNTAKNPSSGGAIWDDVSSVPYGQTFLAPKEVNSIVSTAKRYMGTPYVFGGESPEEGFDCSGFLEYVFAQNGIGIPRTADEQYKLGRPVKSSQLTKGDLVFFTTYEPGASHCGIYLGDDNFIHAASSGVRIDNLNDDYWSGVYYGGKHIVK